MRECLRTRKRGARFGPQSLPLQPEPVSQSGAEACPHLPLTSPFRGPLWTPGLAVTAPLLQLNFSEHLYFENSLQNLKAGAQRSLKKLREKVDQNL